MYGCPGCGGQMVFDIPSQQLKCGHCDRQVSVAEADRMEARQTESTFSVDLLTCPTCGAEIRALNTAAASFCSYCGASVMLERRNSELTPPGRIVPFRLTREECFQSYQEMLKKSWFGDHRLKKNVTADSFRGIYVPFHTYRAWVKGDATLKGEETHGDTTYYYDTKVQLDHEYEGIMHDASREFPDSMSRKVARIRRGDERNFSPAYLSGFYADIPDTEENAYLDYAKTEAVRNGLTDTLKDLKDGCTYSTLPAQKELLKSAGASYSGVTMVPVWFMSMRSGKRVLYAVQNASTGEMAADIPMDIPRFGLMALAFSLILFIILNAFMTLRPEMVMLLSMVLAFAAQLVVTGRLKKVKQKDLDSQPSGGSFDMIARLKDVNKLARRLKPGDQKGAGCLLGGLKTFGAVYGTFMVGVLVYMISRVDNVQTFKLGCVIATLAMGILLLVSRMKWKLSLPAGSLAAFVMMAAGTLVLVLDPFHSADLPVYLVTFACMAAVIWEALELIFIFNRSCSSPLPQFASHQGGEDHA